MSLDPRLARVMTVSELVNIVERVFPTIGLRRHDAYTALDELEYRAFEWTKMQGKKDEA